jgi:hypothetical protein
MQMFGEFQDKNKSKSGQHIRLSEWTSHHSPMKPSMLKILIANNTFSCLKQVVKWDFPITNMSCSIFWILFQIFQVHSLREIPNIYPWWAVAFLQKNCYQTGDLRSI